MKAGTIVAIILVLGLCTAIYYSDRGGSGLKGGGEETSRASANTELYLCPQDNCSQKLISFLKEAKSSAHVMIYSFTKKEIAQELVALKEKGIEVKVLADKGQGAGQGTQLNWLSSQGIEVKPVDLSGYHIFHNKVSIVDGNAFSTGSFNYTENADTGSAENLVIIRNRELSQRMEGEFQKYWGAN